MHLGQRWYAIQVRPRYERIAAAALRAKGYEVFLPTYTRPGASFGRTMQRDQPLFPGYLFCRVVAGVCAKLIVTPGVVRIVSCGREPVAVSEDEIAAIQHVILSHVDRQPCDYSPAGCRVRVESGPLAGIEGILVSDANSRKIVLSISLLQRSVKAVLDPDTLFAPVPESVILNRPETLADCTGP
jgi:transcription antitermination factor NusG